MAFDSLFTGISGLNAYQSQIDMISNDIANVDTTGFKGQRMTFADLYYQSQGFASAPTQTSGGVNPQEVGLGVRVNSIDTNFSQGGLETTGINTDLAINGDGFFVLNNVNGTGQPIYTRDGAFSLNSNGVLYDPSSGLAVQGFMANANGQIQGGTPGTITVPIGLAMQATATGAANATKYGPANNTNFDVSFGGSLNQTQYAAEAATAGSGAPQTVSTTIYDSLGNAHEATITFSPVGPNTPVGGPPPAPAGALPSVPPMAGGAPVQAASRWSYKITFADGTAPATNSGYAFFDQNGQFLNTSSTANAAAGTFGTVGVPTAAQGDVLSIAAGGWPAGDNSAAAPTIGLDFSNMSSLAAGSGSSSSATVLNQNGFAAGTLSNITIGQDGTITGAFTNGQQKTVGQVALATFQNEDGLHRLGGNGFQQTANSGLAQVGFASSGRYGAIVSGSLEQSNVSLADEFTKMITAQRAFEANTRGISTADQNMQTVINIRASEN